MKPKIGILTLPLCTNYGGLLQAYALQTVLKQLGYTPVVVDRHRNKKHPLAYGFSRLKYNLYGVLGKDKFKLSEADAARTGVYTQTFIDTYITPHSPRLYSQKEFDRYIKQHDFKAWIVGSDQVWRPRYAPHLPTAFLDFVQADKSVLKLSYAASFGVDTPEYSSQELEAVKELASLFDALSVRESSGKALCAHYFQREAVQVLDPTLLLSSSHYQDLVEKSEVSPQEGQLFTYILDENDEKKELIQRLAEQHKLKPFQAAPRRNKVSYWGVKKHFDDYIFPPVEQWLRSFIDAKYVITDSFHGCVFSILFNKPFLAIPNKHRGNARFDSLLQQFQLEHALDVEQAFEHFDWPRVNAELEQWRRVSLDFLKTHLKTIPQ